MKRYEAPEVKVSAPLAYEDILVGSDVVIDTEVLYPQEEQEQ